MTLSIDAYHGDNPFLDYPQLQTIWPSELQLLAEKGTVESIQDEKEFYVKNHLNIPDTLFLIRLNNEVIGLTGFYFSSQEHAAHLRWHGIIPQHRRYGYSRQTLVLIAQRLVEQYPHVEHLIESVPVCPAAETIAPYFHKIGFFEKSEPTYDTWSEMYWKSLSCNISQLLYPKKDIIICPMMAF